MIASVSLGRLKRSHWYESLVRFILGGLATAATSLILKTVGPVVLVMRLMTWYSCAWIRLAAALTWMIVAFALWWTRWKHLPELWLSP